jgi:hypothetical protein
MKHFHCSQLEVPAFVQLQIESSSHAQPREAENQLLQMPDGYDVKQSVCSLLRDLLTHFLSAGK